MFSNLYNQRPTYLDLAHRTLDHAALDAYGWPHDLNDDDILGRLPALNLERARAPMVVEAGESIPPAGPRRGGVS